jgi:hypothetical protein
LSVIHNKLLFIYNILFIYNKFWYLFKFGSLKNTQFPFIEVCGEKTEKFTNLIKPRKFENV